MNGFLLAAILLPSVATPSYAQQASTSALDEVQQWAQDLQREVSAEELKEAAKLIDEGSETTDALLDLAAKHHLSPPDWLQARVQADAGKPTIAALGDSISAGTGSCPIYLACPSNSWSIGTGLSSIGKREAAASGREWGGFLVAIPGATSSWTPAEAFALYLASELGLNVQRVTLLIGHNDAGVCGDDSDGAIDSFSSHIAATLSILGKIAKKRGTKVFVSSLVDVPSLASNEAVVPKGSTLACRQIWDQRGICSNVLQHAQDAGVLSRVAARIDAYDAVLSQLAAKRPWALYTGTLNSVTRQGIPDPADNISPMDCFHPSASGQQVLADIVWSGQGGSSGIASFFSPPQLTSNP